MKFNGLPKSRILFYDFKIQKDKKSIYQNWTNCNLLWSLAYGQMTHKDDTFITCLLSTESYSNVSNDFSAKAKSEVVFTFKYAHINTDATRVFECNAAILQTKLKFYIKMIDRMNLFVKTVLAP